jgi:uncharacterized membrane protein YfhO
MEIPAVSDEQYLSRLTPAVIMDGLHRFNIIANTILVRMSDLRQWHLVWLTPVAACIMLCLRRSSVDRRLLFLSIIACCYTIGLLTVYVISPWRDIAQHINVTFDRITLPLLPLFILMIALISPDPASES